MFKDQAIIIAFKVRVLIQESGILRIKKSFFILHLLTKLIKLHRNKLLINLLKGLI